MSDFYDPRFDPLPSNPAFYIKRIARDLAWGVQNAKWPDKFVVEIDWYANWRIPNSEEANNDKSFLAYLDKVWGELLPNPKFLDRFGYLNQISSLGGGLVEYELTHDAFKLTEEITPVSIFISYSRKQSSALALLIVSRFKEHNLSPFLDMHPDREDLPLGGDWEKTIKEAIAKSASVVVLIGPKTFSSQNVLNELSWAMEAGAKIVPIWHHINESIDVPDTIGEELRSAVSKKQGVIVEAENPKQYNAALDQLLAHFNIAP